jgi:hypothetical protein
MAKTEMKTKATDADVGAFVAAVEPETKRADARRLIELFSDITGEPPKLWGPSIIGFGSYHYKYDSGREGDMCRVGFSPRKANIVVYLVSGYENPAVKAQIDDLRARLGKHKVGKSCLYINRLSDIDIDILAQMIDISKAYMDAHYPV